METTGSIVLKTEELLPTIKTEPMEQTGFDQSESIEMVCEAELGKCEIPDSEPQKNNPAIAGQEIQGEERLCGTAKCHSGTGGGPSGISPEVKPQQLAITIDGRKTFCCPYCEYRTTYTTNMRNHLYRHSGEKPHKCPECPSRFTRLDYLRQHLVTHSAEKPHKCKLCSYSSHWPDNLRSHMLTHTGERPHKCQFCSFSTGLATTLKRHLTIHMGERSHKCSVCSFCCSRANDLKRHMVTHSGERPHKCNECSYSCTQPYNLKTHVRLIHNKEKDGDKSTDLYKTGYEQSQGSTDPKEEELPIKIPTDPREMARIIDGRKTYCCPCCQYKTAKCSSIRVHLVKHTGERSLKCSLCPFTCGFPSNLSRHMKLHKRNSPDTNIQIVHNYSDENSTVELIQLNATADTDLPEAEKLVSSIKLEPIVCLDETSRECDTEHSEPSSITKVPRVEQVFIKTDVMENFDENSND